MKRTVVIRCICGHKLAEKTPEKPPAHVNWLFRCAWCGCEGQVRQFSSSGHMLLVFKPVAASALEDDPEDCYKQG